VTDALASKAVVVTGAGHGLGRGYAVAAAAAGADVVVNDIDAGAAAEVVAAITATGRAAVASTHSVADAQQAQALIDLCVEEFGHVDGLVNNAGVNREAAPWEEEPQMLAGLVTTNVLGPMYCGVAAIRHMREQCSGSIVNASSGASLGVRGVSAYGATKGALASLTYGWALELEDSCVRVNAIAPLARTRMVTETVSSTVSLVPEHMTPARVSPVVVYLLSDAAARVTGQFVRFNGDTLQLVAPPQFIEPSVTRTDWDITAVRAAFDDVLAAHLQPFGQARKLPALPGPNQCH
jgi:NAD(P)-dependent dehydrogenase (short-subunit alcohol dehydrogenase family)